MHAIHSFTWQDVCVCVCGTNDGSAYSLLALIQTSNAACWQVQIFAWRMKDRTVTYSSMSTCQTPYFTICKKENKRWVCMLPAMYVCYVWLSSSLVGWIVTSPPWVTSQGGQGKSFGDLVSESNRRGMCGGFVHFIIHAPAFVVLHVYNWLMIAIFVEL